jgi:hypothetical protein
MLKRHSFMPLPMPDSMIQQVNTIGLKEKQGRSFLFLNRQKEPYEWTNKVPEDDLKFQGLLEADSEEAAACQDISAKLPGVELTSKDDDYPAITEEPEADFQHLAAAALDNAGINTVAWLHAARDLADAAAIGIAPHNPRAALVETNKDEIVYEITFDLLDAGLEPDIEPTIPPVQQGNATAVNATNYDLSRSCRSVAEHQPEPVAPRVPITHRTRLQAPRMNFLQLGGVQMHRSVLEARQYAGMTKEERIHATTASITHLEPKVDKTIHRIDAELITESEDEMKVWAYLMTQYNFKPELRKFGARGATAALDELTQLHAIDT